MSIDSPSLGERQAGDYVKEKLENLGLNAIEDDAGAVLGGNCGNIYGYIDGEGEPLLFSSHLDTVEPSRGKRAIISADGTITSDGTTVLGADDMAGVASILEALSCVIESGVSHRPVEVLFSVAEEIYCKGIKEVDFSRIKSKQAYVLDLNGDVGTAAFRAPSITSLTVTVTGKSAHAGFAPEDGIHAILAASRAISEMKMGRLDDGTTVNIGSINGGTLTNIVPDKCVVRGEVRSFSEKSAKTQLDGIESIFRAQAEKLGAKVHMEYSSNGPAFEISGENEVVKRFERICDKQGLKSRLITTYGGSDHNDISGQGIDGLVLACAMNECHTCSEYSSVDELIKSANLVYGLMTDMEELA